MIIQQNGIEQIINIVIIIHLKATRNSTPPAAAAGGGGSINGWTKKNSKNGGGKARTFERLHIIINNGKYLRKPQNIHK